MSNVENFTKISDYKDDNEKNENHTQQRNLFGGYDIKPKIQRTLFEQSFLLNESSEKSKRGPNYAFLDDLLLDHNNQALYIKDKQHYITIHKEIKNNNKIIITVLISDNNYKDYTLRFSLYQNDQLITEGYDGHMNSPYNGKKYDYSLDKFMKLIQSQKDLINLTNINKETSENEFYITEEILSSKGGYDLQLPNHNKGYDLKMLNFIIKNHKFVGFHNDYISIEEDPKDKNSKRIILKNTIYKITKINKDLYRLIIMKKDKADKKYLSFKHILEDLYIKRNSFTI